MRIPKRKPPIDIDDLLAAIAGGESGADYARRNGFSVGAIYGRMRSAGVRFAQRPSKVRDATDVALRSLHRSILDRCGRPDHRMFPLYGARGVRTCREWHDFVAFRDWARETGYMEGRAIAMRSRSRGYRPSNCYWTATSEVITEGILASGNGTVLVTAFGETKSASAWARDPRAKVCGETIRLRVRSGIDHVKAITLAPHEIVRGTLVTYRAATPRGYTVIDWRRVRRLYIVQGLGVSETAKRLGASYQGVLRGIQKRGWQRDREPSVAVRPHGRALYRAWSGMRERCMSPKHPEYSLVGGTGIRVSPDWERFAPFYEWALANGYAKGLVLTRLRQGENFGPLNCAWLSRKDAVKFHRPKKVDRTPDWIIPAFGEEKGPTAWSADPRCKVSLSGLVSRLRAGMQPEQAITQPPQTPGKSGEGRIVRAFGVRKTLADWGRDRRARVGASSIGVRLDQGMKPEAAITTPPFET